MKSSAHRNLVAAAAIALSAVGVAHGQNRAQGFRMGGDSPNDPTYLLDSKSVQTELALTDEQIVQLQKLRSADENGGHPFFGGLRGVSPEDIQKKLEQHAKMLRQKVSKILTAQQVERLNEINIQASGAAALSFDDVAEKIDLSADQRQQLKTINKEARRKLSELYPANSNGPPSDLDRPDLKQKKLEIAEERKTKSLALLTDAQKTKFEELQGKKFDTSTIQPNHRNFTRRGRIEAAANAPPL